MHLGAIGDGIFAGLLYYEVGVVFPIRTPREIGLAPCPALCLFEGVLPFQEQRAGFQSGNLFRRHVKFDTVIAVGICAAGCLECFLRFPRLADELEVHRGVLHLPQARPGFLHRDTDLRRWRRQGVGNRNGTGGDGYRLSILGGAVGDYIYIRNGTGIFFDIVAVPDLLAILCFMDGEFLLGVRLVLLAVPRPVVGGVQGDGVIKLRFLILCTRCGAAGGLAGVVTGEAGKVIGFAENNHVDAILGRELIYPGIRINLLERVIIIRRNIPIF